MNVFVALDVNKIFVAAYDFSGRQQWAMRPGGLLASTALQFTILFEAR